MQNPAEFKFAIVCQDSADRLAFALPEGIC